MLDCTTPRVGPLESPETRDAVAANACDHCQSNARTLFSVSFLNRSRQQVALRVCRFCFIRLAGIQPRRGDLTRTRVIK